jgi:hypothetical protein
MDLSVFESEWQLKSLLRSNVQAGFVRSWWAIGGQIAHAKIVVLNVACGGGNSNVTSIKVETKNTRFHPEMIQVPVGRTVTLKLKNLDAPSTRNDPLVRRCRGVPGA